MLQKLDPRHWLARCVRCGVRGAPLCEPCSTHPLSTATTGGGQRVAAIGPYAGQLGECLRRLKYQDETHLALPLGRALRQMVERSRPFQTTAPWLLLPVPTHPLRLAERGYNQAALIARASARSGESNVVTNCLLRREARAAQARLSGEERRTNLLGAFVARALPLRARGLSILLIDDVVTTGSTVDACVSALAEIDVHVSGVLACAIAGSPHADNWSSQAEPHGQSARASWSAV